MSPDELYPVMVFIHGGAYEGGSNMQYPGHFLAARDVVVVVVNYRVGFFGKSTVMVYQNVTSVVTVLRDA